MDLHKSLGFKVEGKSLPEDERLIQYINLKLAALGYPIFGNKSDSALLDVAQPLLSNHREKNRLLSNYPCPVDRRIEEFLNDYLKEDIGDDFVKLPSNSFILDRHGLARVMSLPGDQDYYISDLVQSYRVKQGVLHNPRHDRRTTKGVFHVAEGGLPIPDDKLAVPRHVFANLFRKALVPPDSLTELPLTSTQDNKAQLFVSLLLRPMVCPEIPGVISKKATEVRFFAPASLVSNLDFVESIFGNGGDPYLPENNSALDAEHWTGHTGCVILAPHLSEYTKKELGLPSYDQATERQRRDGMCWKDEKEKYNNGTAFKVTCRDRRGIMVTLIADNYFGYCKKEVKTQISFASNLYGMTEEEHAGGASAYPSYDLGEKFSLNESYAKSKRSFDEVVALYGSMMEVKPEGYGVDLKYPDLIYVPENAEFDLMKQSVTWTKDGEAQKIKLLAYHDYVYPSGYKIHMEKQIGSLNWRLIGTVAEGTLCHKPCTVSGGGKSEISKSIRDAMIQGPIFTTDFHKDMDLVEEIMQRDFGDRFKEQFAEKRPSRPILSPERSLGSVIKLFTPSTEFSDEYNLWLNTMPHHIKEIIFVVKRHYQQEWGEKWREHFSVDMINGYLGHELKYENRKLVANYLRVGYEKDGSQRIYKLRQDYQPSTKIQVEDDITASAVIPANQLEGLNPEYPFPSAKILRNCEYRLFQRPDDAIHRGYDVQAESDLSSAGAFLSNYQPLTAEEAAEILEDSVKFELYTEPVKSLIKGFVADQYPDYCVSSSHPRVINGKPSKNPRYLQNRPDIVNPKPKYVAEVGTRLMRQIPIEKAVYTPVDAVLPGRRNNPADKKLGVPPLALYNPIHYQELPELFMDFVCSVTGKSPSTTGFGSEGALTKGPFNAIFPTSDLNNALVSYIVTGYHGFSSAAGYVGPQIRVDHDVSLLIPEIWCRMSVEERDPKFLIENGYLEKIQDIEHNGKHIPASILGYRINIRFVHAFLGRIFNNPNAVFSDEMLRPETQGMDVFVEALETLVTTQKRVAKAYINDGSIEKACPPLRALLFIMANGEYEGKDLSHPDIRKMFTREYLLNSDWYAARLKKKQELDIALWEKHVSNIKTFITLPGHADYIAKLGINDRLAYAQKELERVKSADYLSKLSGTIGADTSVWQGSAKEGAVQSAVTA